jgi:phosphoglycolate phosphatase-like HAD superfamily hydrolase
MTKLGSMTKQKFQDTQAAIIDLDGTMLDTAPDFLVAINRMRAASRHLQSNKKSFLNQPPI